MLTRIIPTSYIKQAGYRWYPWVPFRDPSELERQANIARNRALLEELELTDAVNKIGFSKKEPPPSSKAKAKAKPVQPAKRVKREVVEDSGPRRQSARLKRPAEDSSQSPEKKRARLVRSLTHPRCRGPTSHDFWDNFCSK